MPQVRKKAPMKRMLRSATALATIAAPRAARPRRLHPPAGDDPARPAGRRRALFRRRHRPSLEPPELVGAGHRALRQKVKYVFVIFNENRSFDHEYGTFPGVNGLYSDGKTPRAPANTPGFTQSYLDTKTGETVAVQPFRVGPEQNSTIKDSTDHSHTGLAAKLDVKNGVPQMDKFAERRVASIRACRRRRKARRWASSSPASSWRISTATPSRSSGATPAASPSSTTSSPPRTRPRRPTRSP